MTRAWSTFGGRFVALLLVLLLLAALGNFGLLDGERLTRGAQNIGILVGDMFPPDTSVLPTLTEAMLETLQIAFAGTMLGFIAALPLALATSERLVHPTVAVAVKFLLAFVRTVPSLLWALIFVVAVGLGPGAGTLGVALYSVGYLGKILSETFEGVDPEVVEAVRGVGGGPLQLVRYALLPEAANSVLAQLLFMFDYNVRASSVLGFVGAGGIGFYMVGYLQVLQYSRLITALLVTLAVVVVIDQLSAVVRRRFLAPLPAGAG
jgi:phosphonate transport system permease protein